MCVIQRVNGQDKIFKCLERDMVSSVKHTGLSVSKIAMLQGFSTHNSFPCVQLLEALESTWASIPVEHFRQRVESMP